MSNKLTHEIYIYSRFYVTPPEKSVGYYYFRVLILTSHLLPLLLRYNIQNYTPNVPSKYNLDIQKNSSIANKLEEIIMNIR